MDDHVILVDDRDRPTGTMEKLEAHRRGLLHRAFSIFLFSDDGCCLLQRRAAGKYHSGGLWSNACCSHPRPGEKMEEALNRRLEEELGVKCALRKAFGVEYDLDMGNGLKEAEYNHTYIGGIARNTLLRPDPGECSECRWATAEEVERELAEAPETYTAWFAILFPMVMAKLQGR